MGPVLFICVCIALRTIVAHNIAQNRPGSFCPLPSRQSPLLRWCLFEGRFYCLKKHDYGYGYVTHSQVSTTRNTNSKSKNWMLTNAIFQDQYSSLVILWLFPWQTSIPFQTSGDLVNTQTIRMQAISCLAAEVSNTGGQSTAACQEDMQPIRARAWLDSACSTVSFTHFVCVPRNSPINKHPFMSSLILHLKKSSTYSNTINGNIPEIFP